MAMISVGTELLDLITDFNFECVPANWTTSVWESGFSEIQPLNDDILEDIMASDSLPGILHNCCSKCRRYLQLGNDEVFWKKLATRGITRTLVAYLYYLMDCLKNGESARIKRNALLAADIYLCLCAIKGGSAYHVFNVTLFQKSLETLKLVVGVLHQHNSPVRRGRGRGGRGRTKRANQPRSSSFSSIADSSQDESTSEMDADELSTLVHNFLKTLWLFVGHYDLGDSKECLESLTGCLSCLLRVTSNGKDSTHRADREHDLSDRNPAGMAFAILHKLFECGENGRLELIARHSFKSLLPQLLMVSSNGRHVNTSTIPASIVHLRDLAVKFVLNLLRDRQNCVAKSVYIILQHLCAKVTDKADYRAKVSDVVVTLALALPNDTFQVFLQWLNKYSRNPKSGYRAFAIDVVLFLFNKTLTRTANAHREGDEWKALLELCLRLVVGRCSDKAPTVRCRALTSLAQVIEDTGKRLMGTMEHDGDSDVVQRLLMEYVNGKGSNGEPEEAGKEADHEVTENGDTNVAPAPAVATNGIRLLPLLLHRCDDDKTLVRKAAVQALESLCAVVPACLNEDAVSILRLRCMDLAVSVRKQALESTTALLLHGQDENLEKAWLSNVLAAVVDRETAVQEKAVDAFQLAIIDKLNGIPEDAERAWRLVAKVTLDSATTRYTQRILKQLQKRGSITNQLMKLIEQSTWDESCALAAWFLLSEVIENARFDLKMLETAWESDRLSGNTLNYAMKIVALVAKKLSPNTVRRFEMDIKEKLENLSTPSENVAESFNALWNMAVAEKKTEAFYDWCERIGKLCVDCLSPIVYSPNDSAQEGNRNSQTSEHDIVRHLFIIGELFQLCPATMVTSRNFYMILAFVAAGRYPDSRPCSSLASQRTGTAMSQGTGSVKNGFVGNIEISSNIRAHAVIALGKLCLQNEAYAKKSVAILVSELEENGDFSIRNNIVIVLSDLCLRFTSLIDRHISRISRRLRDPSPLVRKQTLTLLTNLLKEDYLKWRGALLFRFLTALLDADDQIRSFAEFCLINILLQRQPTMFYLHFLECLFYFNDTRHPSWFASVDMEGGEEKKEEFALAGKENRTRRLYLYRFMLTQFNDEQRFQLTTRICHEILGAVVDEIVPLDQNSTDEVLADSLIVLASKEMKLTSLSSGPTNAAGGELEEEVDPAAAALMEQAKKTISQTVKQNAMEYIVPTVMSLKIILHRKRRGGLERLLVIYLIELMKDYKNEMKEIMAHDKVLLKEIEYDLKRQEKDATPVQLPDRLF